MTEPRAIPDPTDVVAGHEAGLRESRPSVSVVVPVFNGQLTLADWSSGLSKFYRT